MKRLFVITISAFLLLLPTFILSCSDEDGLSPQIKKSSVVDTDSTFEGELICQLFVSSVADGKASGTVYSTPKNAPLKIGSPVHFSTDHLGSISKGDIVFVNIQKYERITPTQLSMMPVIYYYDCEVIPVEAPSVYNNETMKTVEIDGLHYMLYDVDPSAKYNINITYVGEEGMIEARISDNDIEKNLVVIEFDAKDLQGTALHQGDIFDIHILSARYCSPLESGSPLLNNQYFKKICRVGHCK